MLLAIRINCANSPMIFLVVGGSSGATGFSLGLSVHKRNEYSVNERCC